MAVIGTGSSGIQSIPIIAEQAEQLCRLPAHAELQCASWQSTLTDEDIAEYKANYAERRRLSWRSGGGSPHIAHPKLTMEATAGRAPRGVRKALGTGRCAVLQDLHRPDDRHRRPTTRPASSTRRRSARSSTIPTSAELLIPDDHPIGTKRICTDTNYFQTFNKPHVELVSVRKTPIESIDATGINTTDAHYDLDVIVLATGFDAMTGALAKIDIVGRGGQRLRDDWADGPRTYLGLGVDGFPEPVPGVGPRRPRGAGQHGAARRGARELDRRLPSAYLDEHGYDRHRGHRRRGRRTGSPNCNQRAEATLFPKANSWYMGANVPGKPRVFMLFLGGFAAYIDICAEVASAGYKGFSLIKAP